MKYSYYNFHNLMEYLVLLKVLLQNQLYLYDIDYWEAVFYIYEVKQNEIEIEAVYIYEVK